jgi:glycosyltransferase involved in cell wall biosynthesis
VDERACCWQLIAGTITRSIRIRCLGRNHRQRPKVVGVESTLVSVVICVYNAGNFLRSAVLSVIAQTHAALEILVVDDGSTDGCINTLRDLNEPRMRIVRQDNRGKPAAMNRALAEVRGEFYAIQDADDLSHPRRIEEQLACLANNPDLAAVFCGHELVLEGKHMAPTYPVKDREQCRRDIFDNLDMPAHDPTGMYRMSMVGNMRYDEELHIAEGYDYIARVGERYPMMVLGQCLYSYRISWDTLTRKDPARRRQMLQLAAQKLRERRNLPDDPITTSQALSNRDADNDLVSHFMMSALDQRRIGKPMGALRDAISCLQLHPLDLHYYKPLAYAIAPVRLVSWYRQRKRLYAH